METLAKTLTLGVTDKVVFSETIGPDEFRASCISGKVFSIEDAWKNKGYLGGPYTHEIFVQCTDQEDYKKIIRNQKGWPIYCSVLGKVERSVISEIEDDDHFRVLSHGSPGIGEYLGPRCSYQDIRAILISTKAFTIVPVHAVDYAIKRITINV